MPTPSTPPIRRSPRRWAAAVAKGRAFVEAKTSNASPAPAKVLEVMEANRTMTQAQSAELECETLADLMQTAEFRSTVYAFLDLVQRRAKRPAGAPDRKLARPVGKIGVVGAGLMASQLALLFARQLKVPVVMTDIDQGRVDKGVGYVHAEVDKLLAKGRISSDAANRTKALVSGSVSKEGFADADFVIEAVFEELNVKKQVFKEVEAIVSPECILATNTSSLSVTAMAADLEHPERLVGFHFFNPVAVMPLLEIVRAPKTDDAVLATAFELAKGLKKSAVLVKDAAAFVVNRVLLRLMGEVTAAFDEGTPAEVADNALRPMGLPMTPFVLGAMVGLPVAQHVQESLHAAFGDRFRVSKNLQALIENGVPSIWDPASVTAGNARHPGRDPGADVLRNHPVHRRGGPAPHAGRPGGGNRAHARGRRGGRPGGHRPLHDPGRGLADVPWRHHPVPGPCGRLRAGQRQEVPGPGRGLRARHGLSPRTGPTVAIAGPVTAALLKRPAGSRRRAPGHGARWPGRRRGRG